MENPQETKTKQLKWLGGFFDAEGSISFNYGPNVDIVNTHSKTIFYIKLIMDSVGIPLRISEREKPSKSSKKKRWDICLRNKEGVQLFLRYFSSYIFGKKKQIEVIKEWFDNRDEKVDYADKIKFINQLNNIVVSSYKINKIKEKLKTKNLEKYDDIKRLDEKKDGKIGIYPEFNSMEYLAGVIDGDGCLVINAQFHKKSNRAVRYRPVVSIINTNKEIIERCCSVLKNNDIGYFITFRIAGKTTNRRRWDVVVSGVKRCEKLCNLLEENLITKKEQCSVMLNYCRYRLGNEKSKNDVIGFECKKTLEELKK